MYSRQLSQYDLQYKKLNEKNLKEENEKYLKRVFSYEKSFIPTNRTSKKIIILPSIEAKCSTTKKDFSDFYHKNFSISSPKIKFLNSKKAEKRVIRIKIPKKEPTKTTNKILNEIMMKSLEEQKIEKESKKKEEIEIKEEIEKKVNLQKEINKLKYQKQKIILEIK